MLVYCRSVIRSHLSAMLKTWGYCFLDTHCLIAHIGAWSSIHRVCSRRILGRGWPGLDQLGPSGGYVGPACARFRAYVGPCWPILIDKTENMGKPQNTVNCGMFVGSAAGWAAPLSYGAERTAVRQCHGHGGFLAGYIRIPTARDRWPDR